MRPIGILVVVWLSCQQWLAAGQPTLRDRLLNLAAESRTLAKDGRSSRVNVVTDSLDRSWGGWQTATNIQKFPPQRDLVSYGANRPWLWRYDVRFNNAAARLMTNTPTWPVADWHPELRKLIHDPNSDVRSLAAEALAAYLEPDDVPVISTLLNDDVEGPPALRWNRIMDGRGEMFFMEQGNPGDCVLICKEWQNRKVSDYARIGLRLMTGEDLNQTNFAGWWQTNRDAKTRVWYWRERLQCELGEVEMQCDRTPHEPGQTDAWLLARQAMQARLNAKVITNVGKNLRQQSPEVEAKIRLCAVNRDSSGLGSELDEPLMGPFTTTRLSPRRLMELMAGKNLWPDVDWSSYGSPGWRAKVMAQEIAVSADKFFKRSQIEQLRQLAEQDVSIRDSLALGISRILPPARTGHLDDPDTADGTLRAAILAEENPYARSPLIAELAKIGFERNRDILESQFFTKATRDNYIVRQVILNALITPPLTPAKRNFLGRLLLDPRYTLLWVRTAEHPGCDIDGRLATDAFNAYTDRKDFRQAVSMAFINTESSQESLDQARKIMMEIFLTPADSKNKSTL
jgi:hypothetical protein